MTTTIDITHAPYNCPTNGTSDCRPAFLAARTAFQGQDLIITGPNQTYNFHALGGGAGRTDAAIFMGISNLTVDLNGGTITDNGGTGSVIFGTYDGFPSFNFNPPASARIHSAAAGSSSVRLINPSDYTNFLDDAWIAISCIDLQGGGYPQNQYYIEYIQIDHVDPVTGVITLATPLQETYLSTYPTYFEGSLGVDPDQAGPATIWYLTPDWNCVHEYKNFTFSQGGQVKTQGRDIKFTNVTASGPYGIYASNNKTWTANNCDLSAYEMEVDKLVETVIFENGTITNIQVQSPTPTLMIVDNSDVRFNGTPKNTIVRNGSTISLLRFGTTGYGRTESFTATDSIVSEIGVGQYFNDTSAFTINNGTLSIGGGGIPVWGIPNTLMMFRGYHDSGTSFRVNSITQPGGIGNPVLVTTTLSGNTFPAIDRQGGTLLSFGPHPCPNVKFTNVSGCVDADDLSYPKAYGKPLYSYSKRTYNGLTGSGPGHSVWGRLISLKVNVITPAAGTLYLGGEFNNYPTILLSDYSTSPYTESVNLAVAGETVFTDANRWFSSTFSPYCSSTSAVFSIEIETDQGVPLAISPARLRLH